MTAFVRTIFTNNFVDTVAGTYRQHMINALAGGADFSRRSVEKLWRAPDFLIEGTTDDNTATSPVLALNNEGAVAFPTNTERRIIVETLAWNGANRYRYAAAYRILGGTNPTLVGSEEFITNCIAEYGFTTADGTTTTEDAASCIAPGWWDGATPVAGNVASNAVTISWLGASSPVGNILPREVLAHDGTAIAGDARTYQHGKVTLASGSTEVFVSDVATPAAANWTNSSVVRTSAKVLPPVTSAISINTAPNPDEVTINAVGLASDVVTWRIKVFVGEAELSLLV